MKFAPFDFSLFQRRVLLSQQKQVPLQDKLRELMASVLGKAIEYSGYSAVLHIFVNRDLGEAHVMSLHRGAPTWHAVEDLALRREGVVSNVEPTELPEYQHVEISATSNFAEFNKFSEPYLIDVSDELLELISKLDRQNPEAYRGLNLAKGQKFVVVPLAGQGFDRLGALLFFGDPESDAESALKDRKGEAFLEFARGVSRLIVSIFGGIYDMNPITYLPSYHCPQRKKVALLFAEVRHLDLIARAVDARADMDVDSRRECLRDLVKIFSETIVGAVKRHRGGIDQTCGGEALAIFGEYLDEEAWDNAAVVACVRAIKAAVEAVILFGKAKEQWLREKFVISNYRRNGAGHITTDLAVAVCFGEVEFDYLGADNYHRYMTFGDNVSLVKALAGRAGRTEIDENAERLGGSILVTKSTFLLAGKPSHIVSDGEAFEIVKRESSVKLPGRSEAQRVYSLWPKNTII